MGQHKYNPRALAAARGELPSKEEERRVQRAKELAQDPYFASLSSDTKRKVASLMGVMAVLNALGYDYNKR